MNRLDMSLAIQGYWADLVAAGCARVEVGRSVEAFEDVVSQFEKPEVGANLSRKVNTLPPNQVMWVCCRDAADKPVATMAARYDIVGGWDLSEFLKEYLERIFEGDGGRPVRIRADALDYICDVQGPWVYIGEGHVNNDWRGRDISTNLIRLLMLLSFDEFKPTLTYGFMRKPLIHKGVNTQWGWHNTIENAVSWINPPARKDLRSLYFVSCDPKGIARIAKNRIERLDTLALNT